MKHYLLLLFLLSLTISPVAYSESKQITKEIFKEKQGIIETQDKSGEDIIAIKASVLLTEIKNKPDIDSELQLKTRKILHWFYSKKPEMKDTEFTLEIKALTSDNYWQENNLANLISQIKIKNITIIKNTLTVKKRLSEEEIIKNLVTDNMLPNTVEMLTIDDSNFIASLASKEKNNNTAQEKVAAHQIATRKSQAALTGFVNGENISANESLRTIITKTTSDNKIPIRNDITFFDETLRSVASGALSRNKTQCWETDTSYACVSFIKLEKQ